jgi:hypothetical protein
MFAGICYMLATTLRALYGLYLPCDEMAAVIILSEETEAQEDEITQLGLQSLCGRNGIQMSFKLIQSPGFQWDGQNDTSLVSLTRFSTQYAGMGAIKKQEQG